jgi:hypothetical protein
MATVFREKAIDLTHIARELMVGIDGGVPARDVPLYHLRPDLLSDPSWVPYRCCLFLPQPFAPAGVGKTVQVYHPETDTFTEEPELIPYALDVQDDILPYAAALRGFVWETKAADFGELPIPAGCACSRMSSVERGISVRVIRVQEANTLVLRADIVVGRPVARGGT